MKRCLLVLLFLVPISAKAVLIQTSIGTFDVSEVLGSGLSQLSPEGHPWFFEGDLQTSVVLGREFAAQLGDGLGFPNRAGEPFCDVFLPCGNFGPYFVLGGPIFTHQVGVASLLQDGRVFDFLDDGFVPAYYASATSIPEPDTLFLVLAGMVALGLIRFRRRASLTN